MIQHLFCASFDICLHIIFPPLGSENPILPSVYRAHELDRRVEFQSISLIKYQQSLKCGILSPQSNLLPTLHGP